MLKLYLAGGLFNAAERLHNLYLEKYLIALGYLVVLPQREALKFFENGNHNLAGLVEDCSAHCANPDNFYVGNLDGSDTDSGTAVEYGIAITATGRAVVYRTDFRTAPEKEIGINAMFRAKGTSFIYYPCFFTSFDQVEPYYQALAQKIHEAIQSL